MARLARLSIVNVPHHVTQRGNARQFILASDAERAARKLGNFPSVPLFEETISIKGAVQSSSVFWHWVTVDIPSDNGFIDWSWWGTFAKTLFTVPYRKPSEGFVRCWNRAASDTLVGMQVPREATPLVETTLGTAGANGLFYSVKSIWALGNWVRPSSYLAKTLGAGSGGMRAARVAGKSLAVPIAAEVGLRTGAALDCAIPVN